MNFLKTLHVKILSPGATVREDFVMQACVFSPNTSI